MRRSSTRIAAADDEAITAAPADLARDLRVRKLVGGLIVDELGRDIDRADVDRSIALSISRALFSVDGDHPQEVRDMEQAVVRVKAFTAERCGFSFSGRWPAADRRPPRRS